MTQNDPSAPVAQSDLGDSVVQRNPLVELFGAPAKADILWAIIDSSSPVMSVSDIAEYADRSRPAINRQITDFVAVGILEEDELGRGRVFELVDTDVADAIRDLKKADSHAFREVLSSSPKLEILAGMRFAKHGQTDVSALVDLTSLGSSTIYEHLPELEELGVIVQKDEINGAAVYTLNKQSEFCRRLFALSHELNFAMPEPVDLQKPPT